MGVIIYFGKINLISEHIYEVYSNTLNMRNIMLDVLINFKNGMTYVEENTYIGEDGEQHENIINSNFALE